MNLRSVVSSVPSVSTLRFNLRKLRVAFRVIEEFSGLSCRGSKVRHKIQMNVSSLKELVMRE